MIRMTTTTFVLILALTPITFLFQNCSEGFKPSDQIYAYVTESSQAPTVTFAASPSVLANQRLAEFSFDLKANEYPYVYTLFNDKLDIYRID